MRTPEELALIALKLWDQIQNGRDYEQAEAQPKLKEVMEELREALKAIPPDPIRDLLRSWDVAQARNPSNFLNVSFETLRYSIQNG